MLRPCEPYNESEKAMSSNGALERASADTFLSPAKEQRRALSSSRGILDYEKIESRNGKFSSESREILLDKMRDAFVLNWLILVNTKRNIILLISRIWLMSGCVAGYIFL